VEPLNPARVVDSTEVQGAVWAKSVRWWAFLRLPERAPKDHRYHRDYRDDHDRNTRVREDGGAASELGVSNLRFSRGVVCYIPHDAAKNEVAEVIHRAHGVMDAACNRAWETKVLLVQMVGEVGGRTHHQVRRYDDRVATVHSMVPAEGLENACAPVNAVDDVSVVEVDDDSGDGSEEYGSADDDIAHDVGCPHAETTIGGVGAIQNRVVAAVEAHDDNVLPDGFGCILHDLLDGCCMVRAVDG